MKKIFILIIFCIFLIGCSNSFDLGIAKLTLEENDYEIANEIKNEDDLYLSNYMVNNLLEEKGYDFKVELTYIIQYNNEENDDFLLIIELKDKSVINEFYNYIKKETFKDNECIAKCDNYLLISNNNNTFDLLNIRVRNK